MFKVSSATTVKDLKKFIGANVPEVQKKDPKLFAIIKKADEAIKKNPKSVRKGDLLAIAKDIVILLKDKVVDPFDPDPVLDVVVENSAKPKLQKPKTESKSEPEPEKKPATSKKSGGGKKTNNDRDYATSEMFPETLEVEDSKYELAHDIKSMKDLVDGFNKGDVFIFAYYWTPRQLAQEHYAQDYLEHPDKFDHDLDLATALYVSDAGKVAYALSMYTESLYMIMPEAFKEIDGVRFDLGIEFQIYRAVA